MTDTGAPIRLSVKVTAEDIAKGERLEPCRCPVALAVSRLTHFTPSVLGYALVLDDRVYHFPGRVHRAVQRYDRGGAMEPMEFELEADA